MGAIAMADPAQRFPQEIGAEQLIQIGKRFDVVVSLPEQKSVVSRSASHRGKGRDGGYSTPQERTHLP